MIGGEKVENVMKELLEIGYYLIMIGFIWKIPKELEALREELEKIKARPSGTKDGNERY